MNGRSSHKAKFWLCFLESLSLPDKCTQNGSPGCNGLYLHFISATLWCWAYKFELIVDGEQHARCAVSPVPVGLSITRRWRCKKRHEQGEKKLSAFELNNLLPQWKAEPETKWLSDSPSQTLQQSLKDLDRAYKNFFAKRLIFPVSKKKGSVIVSVTRKVKLEQEIIASSCPKSAGAVTATAGWWKVRLKRHHQPIVRQMVCCDPDRAKRIFQHPTAIWSASMWALPVCHLVGWFILWTAQQLQNAGKCFA